MAFFLALCTPYSLTNPSKLPSCFSQLFDRLHPLLLRPTHLGVMCWWNDAGWTFKLSPHLSSINWNNLEGIHGLPRIQPIYWVNPIFRNVHLFIGISHVPYGSHNMFARNASQFSSSTRTCFLTNIYYTPVRDHSLGTCSPHSKLRCN